jgi:hypothetical protein
VLLRARIKPSRAAFVTGDLASELASYPDGYADIKAAYVTPGGGAYFQTQSYALYRGKKSEAKKPKDKQTGVYFPVSIWDLPVSTPAARSYAVPSNAVHAANFEFEVMGRVNAKVEVEGTT